MILLIDIGNTRIKWAPLTSKEVGSQQAASYSAWDRAALHDRMLASIPKPRRILVANVGGSSIERLLVEGVQEKWATKPEFVRSSAQVAGVRCGYANPEQLGVDRWLGVIAAYHLQGGAACIANTGTAMTIDGVDATGQHLGGAIVPGFDLAVASLLNSTSDIAARAQTGAVAEGLFADNTLGAVHQGVAHMLAAAIDRSVDTMSNRFGEVPVLFLSGGASGRIAPLLRSAYREVPDLVLQGLAVLARL